MSKENDGAWAKDCLNRWRDLRDAESFGELLKWQCDRAYAVALRILYSPAEAEDAVQQTFMKLFSKKPSFQTTGELQTGVYRIETQASLDLLRSKNARHKRQHTMAQQRFKASTRSKDHLEQDEAIQYLREELRQLTPEDRALLTLCCQEGQSITSAANVLELSRETARDRIRTLITGIRGKLANKGLTLSLLTVIGLMKQGRTASATEGLCQSLNSTLPGSTCHSISPATAKSFSASTLIAQAGFGTATFATNLIMGTITVGILGIGTILMYPGKHAISTRANPTSVLPTLEDTNPGRKMSTTDTTTFNQNNDHIKRDENEDEDEDSAIPLKQLPQQVRFNAEASVPNLRLLAAEKNDEDGRTIFEIEGEANGKRYQIKTQADGRVLSAKCKRANEPDTEN